MTPKFRFWDDKGKVMVDWLTANQTAFNTPTASEQHQAKGPYVPLLYHLFHTPWIIPLQFVGAADKNKKEIYARDILMCELPQDPDNLEAGRVTVRFLLDDHADSAHGLRFRLIPTNALPDWVVNFPGLGAMEIMGNIYENPELLKEE